MSQNKRKLIVSMIQSFSVLFAVLTVAQFHFLFSASRLLPNCLALPLVTTAFAQYFRRRYCRALLWMAASTIWFRCDSIVMNGMNVWTPGPSP